MIAYIKGTVAAVDTEEVVIDRDGIGFRINTSMNVTRKLRTGDIVTLHTYMNVREDDISLYGFLSKDEKEVFKLLIAISGIGPRGALAILSTLSVDELRVAVLSEDFKAISKANGIGAKTAQRVVIDLKDKFKLEDVLSGDDSFAVEAAPVGDNMSEAALALTSLGYSNVEALRAIKKVAGYETMSVEDIIKQALKNIM